MGTEAELIIDGAVMQELLTGQAGPVVRHLIMKGDIIITAARVQLAPHNKTGRLSASIVKRFSTAGEDVLMSIVAGAGLNPSYAYWVHEGNGPPGGRIYPKTKKMLAWTTSGARPSSPEGWKAARAAGTAVFARSVSTSKPVRYLTDNIHLVLG